MGTDIGTRKCLNLQGLNVQRLKWRPPRRQAQRQVEAASRQIEQFSCVLFEFQRATRAGRQTRNVEQNSPLLFNER